MSRANRITYGHLRDVLVAMGFEEVRREEGVALRHVRSGAIFVFRPYRETDRLQPAELFSVTQELDARGLAERQTFEALLERTPA